MPDEPDDGLYYAGELARQGRLDEAIQVLYRLLEVDPQNFEVRNAVIEYAKRNGNYASVIYQLMDCSELYVLAGEMISAMEQYHKILRLEETVQLGIHNRTDAVMQVRRLVAQVKPEIYLRIGELHFEHGQIDQAVQYLTQSSKLKSGIWDTHYALGRCYLQKEMFSEAVDELHEVARLTQEDGPDAQAMAYELLGEVSMRQQRPPEETVPWLERAASLYAQGHQDSNARAVFGRIIELDPANTVALTGLAELDGRAKGNS